MVAAICFTYVSIAVGAFAWFHDEHPANVWYGHAAYVIISLVWPVWLPAIIMRSLMGVVMP